MPGKETSGRALLGVARRFTCSPGHGAAGRTLRGSYTRLRVSRAGAVRPPGPAVQAISCVRRGHVHLSFLVAAVGGGSLGGGRWAVRLPWMIAAVFGVVNGGCNSSQVPLKGGPGKNFCTKFCGDFLCKLHSLGDCRGHISIGYQETRPHAVNIFRRRAAGWAARASDIRRLRVLLCSDGHKKCAP